VEAGMDMLLLDRIRAESEFIKARARHAIGRNAILQPVRYDNQVIAHLRELFDHQAWADAAILNAIRANESAASDEPLRKTLHHIVMVQRAFLSIFVKRPFDMEKELQAPASLGEFETLFRETQAEELAFVRRLEPADLSRDIDMPWIPGLRISLSQALLQVVMHSQSHRGQCASRLRALGGTPPATDYILWLKERPAPVWS
jgi:uncharacterized damage-inducible protein DinB